MALNNEQMSQSSSGDTAALRIREHAADAVSVGP